MKNQIGSQLSALKLGGVTGISEIAHDLKNTLSILLLLLDVSRRAGNKAEVGALLDQIVEVMRRLRAQLDEAEGALGLRQAAAPEGVATDRLVAYVAGVHARIAPHIQMHMVLDAGLPALALGSVRGERLLVNLVSNGITSMPEGGTLTLAAHRVPGRKAVRITVSDTGCGIAPEVLARLGEPGFSTKTEAGHGFGFGLSSARALVAAAGGKLSIESDLGAGTRITVELPTEE